MRHKAKILGHKGFIVGTLESSANDGFNDMIKDDFGNIEYVDVTTIENISVCLVYDEININHCNKYSNCKGCEWYQESC